jgi:hypothetical protein
VAPLVIFAGLRLSGFIHAHHLAALASFAHAHQLAATSFAQLII